MDITIKTTLSLVTAIAFSSSINAEPELKGTPQELRHFLHPTENIVSINGSAQEKAYSDKAIINLVITTEEDKLSESLNKNEKIRESIKASLVKEGIKDEFIKSAKFSATPDYSWYSDTPSSYKVVNRMAISITDGNHMNSVAKVSDQLKEAQISDIEFEHTKKDEFNAKVKKDALAKIQEQKIYYEKTLGLSLVPVGIRDAIIHQRPTRGAVALERAAMDVASHKKLSMTVSESQPMKRSTPSFDEIIYETQLVVDYKIIQKATAGK